MKSRRYAFIIVDSTGRPGRRLAISSKKSFLATALVIGTIVGALATTTHGLWRLGAAHEAADLARENKEMLTLIATLDGALPDAQDWARRAEQAYLQLRAKSGLDTDERHLGMGPLERAEPANTATLVAPADEESTVLGLEPWALPLEFDRLHQEATAVLRSVEETLEYFHDAERLLSNTPSVKPVLTSFMTSTFGKRHDPMERSLWVMHKGIDLGGYIGAEIIAPADGVVIFVGRRGGYGQTVVIDHGFGIQTHYAHLSAFRVTMGDHVHRGQVVAEMGSTGKSTGPHLHYEVRRAGEPLNPQHFILD